MINALRNHWPEYLMEAGLLGGFMVSACGFGALLYYPGSAVEQWIPGDLARRALMGIAMGLTAVALIHSPWGKRSGAHMNPAVTLNFLRLGKVAPWDAAFYVAFQCVGGTLGVLLMVMLAGRAISDPSVNYVVTAPGQWGITAAFLAELAISFGMMATVLVVGNHPRLGRFTGLFAGTLVMLYIAFESPVSGMSINPARSFASAVVAQQWTAFWVYLAAPPLGMFLAGECYVRATGARSVHCAKLHHHNTKRCIFCEYQHPELAAAAQEGRQPCTTT